MPSVQISCWCGSSNPAHDSSASSEWCTLPACGHIQHKACIEHWFRGKPSSEKTCPVCRISTSLVTIRNTPDGPRRTLPLVRLFFASDPRSDPESQFSQMPQGEVEDEFEDEIEDDEPVERTLGYRKQVRELGNVLRDVKAERDALRPLASKVERLEAEVERLESEKETREEEFRAQTGEIEELARTVEQLECGQPDLRAEMEDLSARIGEVEGEKMEWELEKEELESVVAGVRRELEEERDERREGEMKWGNERKKLLNMIKLEGNSGAKQIRALKEEAESREKVILMLRVDNDRLEVVTNGKIATMNETQRVALASAQKEVDAALLAKKLAKEDAARAHEKLKKVESANLSWQTKFQKKKDEVARLTLLATTRTGILSDTSSPAPPSKSRAPILRTDSASPVPFKLNNGALPRSSTASKRKHEEIIISDDEDELDVRLSPTKKSAPMPTLLDGVGGSWGRRKEELTRQPSDLHMPDWGGGGRVVGIAAKTKIKVARKQK